MFVDLAWEALRLRRLKALLLAAARDGPGQPQGP
jgi:hypothetical protein